MVVVESIDDTVAPTTIRALETVPLNALALDYLKKYQEVRGTSPNAPYLFLVYTCLAKSDERMNVLYLPPQSATEEELVRWAKDRGYGPSRFYANKRH
jgi:hypothetical protein